MRKACCAEEEYLRRILLQEEGYEPDHDFDEECLKIRDDIRADLEPSHKSGS